MTIQNRNYHKLRRLLPDLHQRQGGSYLQLGSDGREPIFAIVQFREHQRLLLTFIGLDDDVVPDPSISLLVDLAVGTVNALSYRRYTHGVDRIDSDREAAGRDQFLSLWLSNLHEQGYRETPG